MEVWWTSRLYGCEPLLSQGEDQESPSWLLGDDRGELGEDLGNGAFPQVGSQQTSQFHLSANGGKKYNNDEANHIGNYSVLLEKCPVDIYDVDRINWEQSHEKFHSAFAAFPWEVLEVFSPPPRVSFTWRHWGHFTGSYEGKEGDGRLIEMYGFGVAVVNDKLQMVDVEIFYKPEPFIQSLRGTAGSSSTWRGTDILGEGATSHCPFVEKQKRKGFPAGECPVRKAKCEQVKL